MAHHVLAALVLEELPADVRELARGDAELPSASASAKQKTIVWLTPDTFQRSESKDEADEKDSK